jgi:hypothetical protein
MGSANSHSNVNLPVLLAGGGFKHGQHLEFDKNNNYPLSNLFVSMLQRLGIETNEFSTGKSAGVSAASDAGPHKFFAAHCTECHDGDVKKGGLDLTALQADFANAEVFSRWVKIFDRIDTGEMPPKKRDRPPSGELSNEMSKNGSSRI